MPGAGGSLPATAPPPNALHSAGERPCPLLTHKTRPPAASRQVPYFIKPGGQLAATSRAMAQFAARAYAAVSEQPVTTPAARD